MIVSYIRCQARKIFLCEQQGEMRKMSFKVFLYRTRGSFAFFSHSNITGHLSLHHRIREKMRKRKKVSTIALCPAGCCCLSLNESAEKSATLELTSGFECGGKKVVLIIDVQTRSDKFLMTRLMYIAANWCLKRIFLTLFNPSVSHILHTHNSQENEKLNLGGNKTTMKFALYLIAK